MSRANENYPKRRPKRLGIKCKDGKEIELPYSWQTLQVVIIKAGVEMVSKIVFEERGIPLISKEYSMDNEVKKYQKEIVSGYYLYTKNSTCEKFYYLYKIWKELELDWIEEIYCIEK